MGYEERRVVIEIPFSEIRFEQFDRIGMKHDDIVLVHAALALDIENRLFLALRKITDIDTLHLARTKPIEQHHRNHQSVTAADHRPGIDALQEPKCLLRRKRQFAVRRMMLAALDPCNDVVIIAAPLAEPVEELEDRNETIYGIDAFTLGLQILFILQHMPTLRRVSIDIVGRQPPEPLRDFASVILFGRRSDVALRKPFGDDFIQIKGRSHGR